MIDIAPPMRLRPSPASLPLRPQRDYLSYSAITTYQGCPLRYRFRYIDNLPEKTIAASLVFGSAIHRAVEHHYNELLAGNEPPTVEALRGEYDRHWQSTDLESVQFGKDDNLESLGQLAERMFGAFKGGAFAQPEGRILGVEEELRGAVVAGCPDLLGRIDLLVESDEELVVADLKTSRARWSQEQANNSAGQLLLYHELARSLAPRKRIRLQFAVLTKAKEPSLDLHEVPADARRIDRTKKIVERVWRAIDAKLYYPTPSPTQCPSCPFREPCRKWVG